MVIDFPPWAMSAHIEFDNDRFEMIPTVIEPDVEKFGLVRSWKQGNRVHDGQNEKLCSIAAR